MLVPAGLLVPRVPEVFLPLKQCIEILGADLQPKAAQAIVEQCLQGITQKVNILTLHRNIKIGASLKSVQQHNRVDEATPPHKAQLPCVL